jgi:hypothetical protein
MKTTLLFWILLTTLCIRALADGTPTVPASQAEVTAGVNGFKYVTPKTLAGFAKTNYYYAPSVISASATNVAAGGSATASVTGTNNQTWVFGIPVGLAGTNASIVVTNTVTGAAGSSASVTNLGSTTAAILRFTIPTGAAGTNGLNGTNGAAGSNGSNGLNGTNCLASTYTTNFTLGTAQAAWTIVLPSAATNYLLRPVLSLVAQSANPHGITLASGGKIDCAYVTGTLFTQQPYAILDQGDGRTFVVSMDGDKANFLDNTGQPYSFSQAFVADSFQLQAKFTYLIQQ